MTRKPPPRRTPPPKPRPAHIEQFITLCAAIRGPSWQQAVAADLGISPRMIQFYITGARPIPAKNWEALRKLATVHAAHLKQLAATIKSEY